MATPSDFPPSPPDDKSPIPEVVTTPSPTPPTTEAQQASIAQETPKQQDSPPSVFKNSEPLREDQIQNAIKFLSHPRVRGSPVIHRRSFLERKGLTKEEIDEAFRRVPDPSPSSQPTVSTQDGQKAVSNVQPQGQVQAMQPAPVVMVPPPSLLSRFRWYHAALAVGVLAASGAGTAVFVKKSLIPRIKSWVRRIMLEEETDPLKKADAKPSLAEEAVAAAKAASAAASDVARVSQELMITKSEERKYFEDLTRLLGVQVQEMKSLSNNIRNLEGNYNNLPKVYSADQEVYGGGLVKTSAERRSYANGSNIDYDTRSARSASPPPAPPADSSMPPHPKSYMDIMSMIQRGEKPSNIREINDMPPNPNQQLSNSRIAPKTKPWDYGQAPQEENANGPWWQQKNPRSTDFGYETTASRSIGIPNETNTMEPAALPRQRSWVPPQPPPVVMTEAAEAIRLPKPQAKIDQEAAASDDQSGVSDELQKINKFSETGGDGSGNLQITEIQEEREQQQFSQEGN
ncbi:PREDICTED: peroxisomal membrane protein PEX14 [Brassica oleracea var. oleracea]|uniref:Peroxisomal membrane protein PEX14 n=1 Tax=Brassica oleracea var. oleracea TaxID=109376 RepID=A0A0D3BFM5_BRAOL|nr:PREDICTED: peroxisomal membrane protein PEX14 [Brassica oleracea var. oleracea]